jgi:hypothetical protein
MNDRYYGDDLVAPLNFPAHSPVPAQSWRTLNFQPLMDTNRANGMSEIEGKGPTVGAERARQRASFNRHEVRCEMPVGKIWRKALWSAQFAPLANIRLLGVSGFGTDGTHQIPSSIRGRISCQQHQHREMQLSCRWDHRLRLSRLAPKWRSLSHPR